ncbi:hypothetical protein ANN_06429 [Periplaneta americana]|uniref:Mos1 transposase HTH domain-containing protein n=1 Tax=Periplaneta americana TaxID=6978 RepID=A0ABQ8TFA4_PERAM|nr:hypothetical protein ANN_06429 [Periplaneta americana]
MSPGSSTESYSAFARIGLRENPGKTSTRIYKSCDPQQEYVKIFVKIDAGSRVRARRYVITPLSCRINTAFAVINFLTLTPNPFSMHESVSCIAEQLKAKWSTTMVRFIKFLVEEEKSAAEIHLKLQRAYGDVCMGPRGVRRWVKHFEDGNTSIQDEPSSGRSRTASNKERVDELWDGFWLNFLNLNRP